tara:strand:+ start:1108 stop:2427 length:1320 start_codon:yes stop_codon:yes gene_type:complete
MKNKGKVLIGIASFLLLASLTQLSVKERDPNVIIIMADDMGFECLGAYGSTVYKTPHLDSLAKNGILFENCVSQPLCTPSRVKLMTGKYNYRNYEKFGYLNPAEYTFGNLMKDAGYKTCISGKWQLNGLAYKDQLPNWQDKSTPQKFGFDDSCLWQVTRTGNEGGRYAEPVFEKNGEVIHASKEEYGPDFFSDFVVDFIEKQKEEKFFIYYPMVLVHDPFVPTPDSKSWKNEAARSKQDTANFKDMVAYTDKIVGKIMKKLKSLDLDKNTLVIFIGDNGTHPSITSQTVNRIIQGGKGNTIDAGTHVPFIAYWPNEIKKGRIFEPLIEFSDFFPTLAEIAGKSVKSDGKGFLKLLKNENYKPRETAFVHYDPLWSNNVNRYRNQFVRSLDYKLYQDGKIYNLSNDILEQRPLAIQDLDPSAKKQIEQLKTAMRQHPDWK